MGDTRFRNVYDRVARAERPLEAIRGLVDEDLVAALAAASREHDPYLANVLATEAQNRAGQTAALLRHMGDGAYVLDPEGRARTANPALAKLLGRRPEELVGRDVHDVTACVDVEHRHSDRSTRHCPIMRVVRALVDVESDCAFRRADGSDAIVSMKAVPVARDGVLESVVVVVRDVARRRRAEEEARSREDRMNGILHAVANGLGAVGVMVFGADGRACFANAVAERILGNTARPLTESDAALFHLDGRPLAPPDRPCARVLRTGEPVTGFECVVEREDGGRVIVSLDATPVHDAVDGRIGSVVLAVRDVTERRLAELDALRALDRLARAEAGRVTGPPAVLVDAYAAYARAVEGAPGAEPAPPVPDHAR